MNCKHCGAPHFSTDRICSYCKSELIIPDTETGPLISTAAVWGHVNQLKQSSFASQADAWLADLEWIKIETICGERRFIPIAQPRMDVR